MLRPIAVFVTVLLLGVVIHAALGGRNAHAELERYTHRTVKQLLSGIPQEGATLGDPRAPVTLQVFADLECHDSRNWFTTDLPPIVQAFVRPGILKIEYRSFKTDTIWPAIFVNQQTAALAAGAQNKMWDFIETFYNEQGTEYTRYATESYLDNIASQVPGLRLGLWHRDRRAGRRSEQVVEDDRTARTTGFHDTPSYLIGPTGGELEPLVGRDVIKYARQKNPVSLLHVEDVQKAIDALRHDHALGARA